MVGVADKGPYLLKWNHDTFESQQMAELLFGSVIQNASQGNAYAASKLLLAEIAYI